MAENQSTMGTICYYSEYGGNIPDYNEVPFEYLESSNIIQVQIAHKNFLPVLTDRGRTHVGWYLEPEFLTLVNVGDIVQVNNGNYLYLYAKWESDKAIIEEPILYNIADNVRTLNGTEDTMTPDEMNNELTSANEEVEAQSALIDQLSEMLEGKAAGGGNSNANGKYVIFRNSGNNDGNGVYCNGVLLPSNGDIEVLCPKDLNGRYICTIICAYEYAAITGHRVYNNNGEELDSLLLSSLHDVIGDDTGAASITQFTDENIAIIEVSSRWD